MVLFQSWRKTESLTSTVEKCILSALLLWLFITYLIEETVYVFSQVELLRNST